jgi:hypothetical protein
VTTDESMEMKMMSPKLFEALKPITVPLNVEIVRKSSKFRTTVERKLGIDWEHGPPGSLSNSPESL